jgi:hypothetical protein
MAEIHRVADLVADASLRDALPDVARLRHVIRECLGVDRCFNVRGYSFLRLFHDAMARTG